MNPFFLNRFCYEEFVDTTVALVATTQSTRLTSTTTLSSEKCKISK